MTLELLAVTIFLTAGAVFTLMTAAAYLVLLERRIAAFVQDRPGPNRVGIPLTRIRLFGLGQPLADGVKIVTKEDFTPSHVNRVIFVLAPLVILVSALGVFAVIPLGSVLPSNFGLAGVPDPLPLVVAPGFDVALLFIFALNGIAVYGVILGGWASNNKYSFLGGLRSSAQLIAYELPLGLGILGVVLASGTLDVGRIIDAQADSGVWFAFAQPLGFIVFLIAAFAEAARLPFDLPECEQELIGGYHTEYGGVKLLMFLVGEFLHMVTASFLIVVLFFGGWHFWGLTDMSAWLGESAIVAWIEAVVRIGVLLAKVMLVILAFMVIRWSWPRFRFDQLMALAWKVMLPLGLVNLTAVAILAELTRLFDPAGENPFTLVWTIAAAWGVCIAGWLAFAFAGQLITDNRPRRDLHPYEIDPQI